MPELAVKPFQDNSISEGEIAIAVMVIGTAREEVLKEGVEVEGVVDAIVEVADGIVVEAVDVATTGDDEEAEVLDEEDCVGSVDVEEDAVLEVDPAVVDEAIASEKVADEDEVAVWAEEKWTNGRLNIAATITTPIAIPIFN